MSLIQTIIDNPTAFIERIKEDQDYEVFDLYMQESSFDLDGEWVHLRMAYSEGGGEGEGDYVERVIGVKVEGETEIFLRTTGFYSSYEGTEWTGRWVQVFPQEVTVVRYAEAGKQARV